MPLNYYKQFGFLGIRCGQTPEIGHPSSFSGFHAVFNQSTNIQVFIQNSGFSISSATLLESTRRATTKSVNFIANAASVKVLSRRLSNSSGV